jgi:hypothetical protein
MWSAVGRSVDMIKSVGSIVVGILNYIYYNTFPSYFILFYGWYGTFYTVGI